MNQGQTPPNYCNQVDTTFDLGAIVKSKGPQF